MKSNLDNCFYFTVFKDHRPSMAITNWLKHRHFPFLKNKLAVCLQDFVLIALCVVRMLMKDLKESFRYLNAQFNTQETPGSKNACKAN